MRLSAPRFFAKGRARARLRVMCFVLMFCVGVMLCCGACTQGQCRLRSWSTVVVTNKQNKNKHTCFSCGACEGDLKVVCDCEMCGGSG